MVAARKAMGVTAAALGLSAGCVAILFSFHRWTAGTPAGATTEHRHARPVASAPPVIGVLGQGGKVLAKRGGLAGPWTSEFAGVAQLAVASDSRRGPLVAVLTKGGRVLAKQGSLAGPWTSEYAGVAQLAVASDGRHGPLVAVLTKGGRVLAKQGSLTGPWTSQLSSVSQVADAG